MCEWPIWPGVKAHLEAHVQLLYTHPSRVWRNTLIIPSYKHQFTFSTVFFFFCARSISSSTFHIYSKQVLWLYISDYINTQHFSWLSTQIRCNISILPTEKTYFSACVLQSCKQNEWNVLIAISLATAFPTTAPIRSLISEAAAVVNVIARMFDGGIP